MIYEIEKDKWYGFKNSEAKLRCYINDPIRDIGRRHRMAIIICPGGGYSMINQREGYPVAARFFGYGCQAFVLNYSTGKGSFKKALSELVETIKYIKDNAAAWDVDQERIVVCGFSAGGHLAGMAAISDYASGNRPNALLLGYPVTLSMDGAHEESMNNCLEEGISRQSLNLPSLVDKDFPPSFIWANSDDNEVFTKNSLELATSLSRQGIPYELHVFTGGGHGLSLGDDCSARVESQIQERYSFWYDLSLSWLEEVL